MSAVMSCEIRLKGRNRSDKIKYKTKYKKYNSYKTEAEVEIENDSGMSYKLK